MVGKLGLARDLGDDMASDCFLVFKGKPDKFDADASLLILANDKALSITDLSSFRQGKIHFDALPNFEASRRIQKHATFADVQADSLEVASTIFIHLATDRGSEGQACVPAALFQHRSAQCPDKSGNFLGPHGLGEKT